jgi:hypothetical protein
MLTLLSLLDARLDDTGVCVSATLQHLEVLPSVAPGRSRTSVSTDLSTTLAMPTTFCTMLFEIIELFVVTIDCKVNVKDVGDLLLLRDWIFEELLHVDCHALCC